jgi:hypothetical protein
MGARPCLALTSPTMPPGASRTKMIELDVNATCGGSFGVTAGRQQDMAKGAFHTTRSRWKEKEGVVGEGARAREEAMGRGLEGRGEEESG